MTCDSVIYYHGSIFATCVRGGGGGEWVQLCTDGQYSTLDELISVYVMSFVRSKNFTGL